MLKFSKDNAKLHGQGIVTFNLPAGYSCPGARECKTFADQDTGAITDAPGQRHRCYMATLEGAFTTLRDLVWHNFDLLTAARTTECMVELLTEALPRGWRGVRIHADGDFFNLNYFRAWMIVAGLNPKLFFYAYTKSLPFWVLGMQEGIIPANMTFVASRGGRFDKLIDKHDLREAIVVHHPDEAAALGLKIDKDDTLAQNGKIKRFALLLHGTGPAGSAHSKALKRMRDEGIEYTYSRRK